MGSGGGSRISRLGGGGGRHRPLTWALFGENVCENERIGSRWGGGRRRRPLDQPIGREKEVKKRQNEGRKRRQVTGRKKQIWKERKKTQRNEKIGKDVNLITVLHSKWCDICGVRRDFFYLLDYVTPRSEKLGFKEKAPGFAQHYHEIVCF